ncbi:hypothetical protein JQ615_35695 [Bradyrhizobium jicamae]|uniref:Uncharacterized protein n=1 Tax=Bradyrhizobium jicamae TaxID=280332 RepID=A0ABS5FV52_9BRAD|nr:hypothetical protein [Bradyrhizobium jicamae]MBR0800719.1 hypothetical protein [Bradyrhizobium jicamae]MBR0936613.1 hypothetical protein [Bradyrhizobium jicamae]
MVSGILVQKPGFRKFFWNIDAEVGLNSPNRTDDVQLVQLGYAFMAMAPTTPNEIRATFAAVQVGAFCTGRDDDPLVQAIFAHESSRGGTVDGHVSVIGTSNGIYMDSSGPHTYMLTALVNNIQDGMPNDFPRLDKHPACPPDLKAAVLKVLIA